MAPVNLTSSQHPITPTRPSGNQYVVGFQGSVERMADAAAIEKAMKLARLKDQRDQDKAIAAEKTALYRRVIEERKAGRKAKKQEDKREEKIQHYQSLVAALQASMVKTGSGHNAAPGVAINTVSRLQSEAKTLSEQRRAAVTREKKALEKQRIETAMLHTREMQQQKVKEVHQEYSTHAREEAHSNAESLRAAHEARMQARKNKKGNVNYVIRHQIGAESSAVSILERGNLLHPPVHALIRRHGTPVMDFTSTKNDALNEEIQVHRRLMKRVFTEMKGRTVAKTRAKAARVEATQEVQLITLDAELQTLQTLDRSGGRNNRVKSASMVRPDSEDPALLQTFERAFVIGAEKERQEKERKEMEEMKKKKAEAKLKRTAAGRGVEGGSKIGLPGLGGEGVEESNFDDSQQGVRPVTQTSAAWTYDDEDEEYDDTDEADITPWEWSSGFPSKGSPVPPSNLSGPSPRAPAIPHPYPSSNWHATDRKSPSPPKFRTVQTTSISLSPAHASSQSATRNPTTATSTSFNLSASASASTSSPFPHTYSPHQYPLEKKDAPSLPPAPVWEILTRPGDVVGGAVAPWDIKEGEGGNAYEDEEEEEVLPVRTVTRDQLRKELEKHIRTPQSITPSKRDVTKEQERKEDDDSMIVDGRHYMHHIPPTPLSPAHSVSLSRPGSHPPTPPSYSQALTHTPYRSPTHSSSLETSSQTHSLLMPGPNPSELSPPRSKLLNLDIPVHSYSPPLNETHVANSSFRQGGGKEGGKGRPGSLNQSLSDADISSASTFIARHDDSNEGSQLGSQEQSQVEEEIAQGDDVGNDDNDEDDVEEDEDEAGVGTSFSLYNAVHERDSPFYAKSMSKGDSINTQPHSLPSSPQSARSQSSITPRKDTSLSVTQTSSSVRSNYRADDQYSMSNSINQSTTQSRNAVNESSYVNQDSVSLSHSLTHSLTQSITHSLIHSKSSDGGSEFEGLGFGRGGLGVSRLNEKIDKWKEGAESGVDFAMDDELDTEDEDDNDDYDDNDDDDVERLGVREGNDFTDYFITDPEEEVSDLDSSVDSTSRLNQESVGGGVGRKEKETSGVPDDSLLTTSTRNKSAASITVRVHSLSSPQLRAPAVPLEEIFSVSEVQEEEEGEEEEGGAEISNTIASSHNDTTLTEPPPISYQQQASTSKTSSPPSQSSHNVFTTSERGVTTSLPQPLSPLPSENAYLSPTSTPTRSKRQPPAPWSRSPLNLSRAPVPASPPNLKSTISMTSPSSTTPSSNASTKYPSPMAREGVKVSPYPYHASSLRTSLSPARPSGNVPTPMTAQSLLHSPPKSQVELQRASIDSTSFASANFEDESVYVPQDERGVDVNVLQGDMASNSNMNDVSMLTTTSSVVSALPDTITVRETRSSASSTSSSTYSISPSPSPVPASPAPQGPPSSVPPTPSLSAIATPSQMTNAHMPTPPPSHSKKPSPRAQVRPLHQQRDPETSLSSTPMRSMTSPHRPDKYSSPRISPPLSPLSPYIPPSTVNANNDDEDEVVEKGKDKVEEKTAEEGEKREEKVGGGVDFDELSEVSEYQPMPQSLLSTRSMVSSFATDESSVWSAAMGGKEGGKEGGRDEGRYEPDEAGARSTLSSISEYIPYRHPKEGDEGEEDDEEIDEELDEVEEEVEEVEEQVDEDVGEMEGGVDLKTVLGMSFTSTSALSQTPRSLSLSLSQSQSQSQIQSTIKSPSRFMPQTSEADISVLTSSSSSSSSSSASYPRDVIEQDLSFMRSELLRAVGEEVSAGAVASVNTSASVGVGAAAALSDSIDSLSKDVPLAFLLGSPHALVPPSPPAYAHTQADESIPGSPLSLSSLPSRASEALGRSPMPAPRTSAATATPKSTRQSQQPLQQPQLSTLVSPHPAVRSPITPLTIGSRSISLVSQSRLSQYGGREGGRDGGRGRGRGRGRDGDEDSVDEMSMLSRHADDVIDSSQLYDTY